MTARRGAVSDLGRQLVDVGRATAGPAGVVAMASLMFGPAAARLVADRQHTYAHGQALGLTMAQIDDVILQVSRASGRSEEFVREALTSIVTARPLIPGMSMPSGLGATPPTFTPRPEGFASEVYPPAWADRVRAAAAYLRVWIRS